MSKAKKHKSCIKGYPCGGACISVRYACRKEFVEGVSVSLDTMRPVIAEKIKTDGGGTIGESSKDAKLDKDYQDRRIKLESELATAGTFEKDKIKAKIARLDNYNEAPNKERYLKELDNFEKVSAKQEEAFRTGTKKDIDKAIKDVNTATNKLKVAYYDEKEKLGPTSVKDFTNKAEVMIQTKVEALPGITKDGRFKNVFEGEEAAKLTIGEGGDDYLAVRRRAEKVVMGVPYDAKPSDRPIYGYIENPDRSKSKGSTMGDYGDIQMVLNEDTKRRSTFTVGDSLQRYTGSAKAGEQAKAYSMVEPYQKWMSKEERFAASSSNWSYKNQKVPYVEAQIRGGVTLGDIKEVRVPRNLSKDPRVENLRQQGVKVIEVPPKMKMS